MSESHPRREVIGNGQDASEGVDFELVEGFVDGGFEEGFELVHAVFDLGGRFGVVGVGVVVVCVSD